MDICYFCNSVNDCQLYDIIITSTLVGENDKLNDKNYVINVLYKLKI